MKQYRVVLVDDEDQVRGRIKSFLDERDDFYVIASASNGYDAVELIDIHKPDVVITDIRMPYINGIELTKIIRRDFGNIKVAYISGYDDFMYAKEAIDLDVYTYLMKPVSKADLNTFLDDLYKTLNEEYDALYNTEKLKEIYQESLPLLIENQFNRLLQIKKVTPKIIKQFETYDIDLTKGEFVLSLIEIDDNSSLKEIETLRVFLMNMIPTSLKRFYNTYVFNHVSYIVVIINDTTIDQRELENDLNAMLNKITAYQSTAVWVGVSTIFNSFTEVQDKFQEALHALSYNQYVNVGSLIFYDDIITQETTTFSGTNTLVSQLESTIKYGSENDIDNLFKSIEQTIENTTSTPINLRYFITNVLSAIIRFADSISVDLNDLNQSFNIEKLFEYNNLSLFLNDVKAIILSIRKKNEQATQQKSNELILSIVDYIDNNYQDKSIQMETICDKFSISVSYLSVLIKRETGKTFNKYLTYKRMENAKELIKYSSKKITEVAQTVGYQDVYHFSHTFKKYTGLSPKEYRDET